MRDLLDLDRYPIDQPHSAAYTAMVESCRRDMQAAGMFNLHGFVRPAAYARAVQEVRPKAGIKPSPTAGVTTSISRKRCRGWRPGIPR